MMWGTCCGGILWGMLWGRRNDAGTKDFIGRQSFVSRSTTIRENVTPSSVVFPVVMGSDFFSADPFSWRRPAGRLRAR